MPDLITEEALVRLKNAVTRGDPWRKCAEELLAGIEGERPCERCNGTGRSPASQTRCPNCGGTGKQREKRMDVLSPREQDVIDTIRAVEKIERGEPTITAVDHSTVVFGNTPSYALWQEDPDPLVKLSEVVALLNGLADTAQGSISETAIRSAGATVQREFGGDEGVK